MLSFTRTVSESLMKILQGRELNWILYVLCATDLMKILAIYSLNAKLQIH